MRGAFRLSDILRRVLLRDLQQLRELLLRTDIRQHQRAQMCAHIADKHLNLASLAHHLVNHAQRTGRIRGNQPIRKVKEEALVRRAQHAKHEGFRQAAVLFLCIGKAHVHDGPRIAHAALRRTGDSRQRGILGMNLALLQGDAQAFHNLMRGCPRPVRRGGASLPR